VADIYAHPDQYKPIDVPYIYDIPENALSFHYFSEPGLSADMDEVRLLGNAV
jgi:hypothetical protein